MAALVQRLQRLARQPLERMPASRDEAFRLFNMAVDMAAAVDTPLVLTPGDATTLKR